MLDTNVLVSAFVFPGPVPNRVWRLVREGYLTSVTSQAILDEFEGVLARKFQWDARRAREATRHVQYLSTLAEPRITVEIVSENPPDNRILECAVEGRANFIVTGDHRHLLLLKVFRGIRLVPPAQLLAEVIRP